MSQFYKTNSLINLQDGLKEVYEKMIEHEQRGEYQDAQRCRVEWEHRKQELKIKNLQQMHNRHNREKYQLTEDMNQQIQNLNQLSNLKVTDFHQKSQLNISNLFSKHEEQCSKLQEDLSLQLSTKVKESSQLLNLRKIQEQMAKHKNYAQAHRVQQKIKKLFAHQQQTWLEKRTQKINQALVNLRNKQAAELTNLKQRIRTTEEDNTKEHHFETLRIKQRYQNVLKDLKAQQQREILSFKGEFKTLGGGSPSSSPNGKSKISDIKA